MMKSKVLLSIVLTLISCRVLNSQNFEKNIYDFGTINVKEKQLSCSFPIVNTSTTPIIINSAYAHCSCIDAIWTQTPIAVSDTGYVMIHYNILGSGYFKKSIKVSTNKGRYTLWVTGNAVRTKK